MFSTRVVVLDTSILEAEHFRFLKGSSLQAIEELANSGKIKILMSRVVIDESKSHIRKEVRTRCEKLCETREKLLKDEDFYGKEFQDYLPNEIVDKDRENIANTLEENFQNYITRIKAEVIGYDKIDLQLVMLDHFEIEPPFEEKKRKEFKDAFIIQQIINWVNDNEKMGRLKLAVVSKDKGMCNAFEFKFRKNQLESELELYEDLKDLTVKIAKEDEEYELAIKSLKGLEKNILDDVNKQLNGLCFAMQISDDNSLFLHYHKIQKLERIGDIIREVTFVKSGEIYARFTAKMEVIVMCDYFRFTDNIKGTETDSIRMSEKHIAMCPFEVIIDSIKEEFQILPIGIIVLGSETRVSRCEIG